jgi:outer membrane protein assembly factor BamB
MDPQATLSRKDQKKPLRLWPGIVIVILQWLLRYGLSIIMPDQATVGILAGVAGGVAIVIWWAFFSRAPGMDRWIAILLMILALYGASLLIHPSIATGGQGMMYGIFAIPVLSLAFVVWAVATRHLSTGSRYVWMVVTILIASGFWIFLRNDGITGDFEPDFVWRWSKTPEERLLASESEEPVEFTSGPAILDPSPQWPGFRGPERDGVVRGLKIETDWSESPPEELWRKPVGPGCSSFAVSGDYFFTQEQRGEEEIVSCYNINTGMPVWRHHDNARFWDSHAGAGPRGTPALMGNKVYTLGATGILNALDARNGKLIWSRNAATDAGIEHSGWGYCCSPLIVDDVVIIAIAGKLAAYDTASGEPRWTGPDGGDSYSSPHLATIDGIPQVLFLCGDRLISVHPEEGTLLWDIACEGASHIVQPALTADGDLLVSEGDDLGISRVGIKHGTGEWKFAKQWTSAQIKPMFNDFVVHKGNAYGFSGPMLACLDINSGAGKWRSGRYGGQILLLADSDLLLVLSEKGDVVLVDANPDAFKEVTRMKAIDGKTWNHPVVAGDVLLVRNTEEMAAYRLPVENI